MRKIKIDPEKRVTLYSKEFDEMRNSLDIAIREAMETMNAKGINTGSVGLKIDMAFAKMTVADDNAQTGERPSLKAVITFKIGTVLQQKGEYKGKVLSLGDNKELLVDDTGKFFLVSGEEASGQLSMFNSWDEFEDEVTGGEDDEEDE